MPPSFKATSTTITDTPLQWAIRQLEQSTISSNGQPMRLTRRKLCPSYKPLKAELRKTAETPTDFQQLCITLASYVLAWSPCEGLALGGLDLLQIAFSVQHAFAGSVNTLRPEVERR